MKTAFKYRIYPTPEKEILLSKSFGCVRFFWNHRVESFNKQEKELKSTTELRKEFPWMGEVSAAILQQKERDFIQYRRSFFSKDRKKKIGRCSFKKKWVSNDSFRLPESKFTIKNHRIRLEKIWDVKAVFDRKLEWKPISATVSRDKCGTYFVSIITEREIAKPTPTGNQIWIDVGLKEFAVLSNGEVIWNPKFLRESQAELRTAQKHLSRKKKGSVRRKKAILKVARIHRRIARQRDYFLHNLSSELVERFDFIAIEDLNVSGMVKNHNLAKSISDASWSEFFRMLEYKAEWYGKTVQKVDRFFASSKICNHCGHRKTNLKLSDREIVCESCGTEYDRDHNASMNILRQWLKMA